MQSKSLTRIQMVSSVALKPRTILQRRAPCKSVNDVNHQYLSFLQQYIYRFIASYIKHVNVNEPARANRSDGMAALPGLPEIAVLSHESTTCSDLLSTDGMAAGCIRREPGSDSEDSRRSRLAHI